MQQSWRWRPASLLKRDYNTSVFLWIFQNYFWSKFLYQKKNFKRKKVSGEIAFVLITLFHVQIQEAAKRSTTTRAVVFHAKFAEFYYHKTFGTWSWWRLLNVSVDERCPLCLSITRDKRFLNATWLKGTDVSTPTDKCLMDFNQGVVFTAQIW